MRGVNKLKDLRRCKRGNALIIVAAALPLLIGASAVGLDTIQLTLAKRELQRSADSAAMAGAMARAQAGTTKGAQDAAERDLVHNNFANLILKTIENAPSTGSYKDDVRAVRVVLKTKRDVPFISFFTGEDIDVEVEATATALPDGKYCVISLEKGATTGVSFGGSAKVDLGCGIITNSTGTTAITYGGGPKVTASPVAARGGVPAASNFLGDTVVISNAPLQADPYASLPNPTLPSNCNNKTSVGAKDDEPAAKLPTGVFCFKGLRFDGKVTLDPGTYYIDGSELEFGANADVTGTGVTFILTSSNIVTNPDSVAGLKMNGSAEIKLTAPETGTYAKVLIYQDRRASVTESSAEGELDETKANKNHINGGSTSYLDGAIYMPNAHITFNGNAGFDVRCMRLVTLRVKFSGTGDVINNCDKTDPDYGYAGVIVRLVG